MALTCNTATNITTQTADLSGQTDAPIPVNEFLRIAISTVSGGPYTPVGVDDPGTNTAGQVTSESATGLSSAASSGATYFYVIQHIANDGTTVLEESGECSFMTLPYNPTCSTSLLTQTSVQVTACADFVAPDQQLQIVSSPNPLGPFNTVEGGVPGTFVDNQCQNFNIVLVPCETKYFKARVTPTPASYEVDWQYAHMNRINGTVETVTLTLGDEALYPAGQVVVDVDARSDQGTWHVKSGTFPVPAGVTQLHMGFTGTGGTPNQGNYLDSCSIVLRQVFPSAFVVGEQLINGDFEFPVSVPGIPSFCQTTPNGGYTMIPEATPGFAWETTAPDGLIEIWHGPSDFDCGTGQPNLPISANTGDQWAELSANFESELFQVVNLAVGTAESEVACPVTAILLTCELPSNITQHEATLQGTYCAPPGHFVAFRYSTNCFDGPWTHQTPLQPVQSPGGPFDVEAPVYVLDCGTQYCFQTILFDENLAVIATSGDDPMGPLSCSFFTNPCGAAWCGGEFDPNNCIPVDIDGDGDSDYFNCNQF